MRNELIDGLADRPLVVLTGAGLSTDSGIPDYRGPGAPTRRPMTFQEFVSGPEAAQRYWARSFVGWSLMSKAAPNAGHHALVRVAPELLITQNVDGLHERAGSRPVVALHGRVSEVICLDCGRQSPRIEVQERLALANPTFAQLQPEAAMRPDGDAVLRDTSNFRLVGCTACGGRLKPDVVFFGENVPTSRVAQCQAAINDLAGPGGALLVVGSSLSVMSGLRFVKQAVALGIEVVIINRGETRGDPLATAVIHEGASEFLTALALARV